MPEGAGRHRSVGRGGFFAIDHRIWGGVIGLGMNAAVAYLVMARGTGGDQRTTSWSVNAVEERTGISRPKAKVAIDRLIKAGLVAKIQGGTKPRYQLQGPPGPPTPDQLEGGERRLYDMVAAGNTWVPKVGRYDNEWGEVGGRPYEVALSLAKRGVLQHLGSQHFQAAQLDDAAEPPDWVWLPNALVDGADGEPAPIELVRQSSRVAALRLLVDLYKVQSLQHDNGVPFRMLRKEFERHRVGQQGPYIVWGFAYRTNTVWQNALTTPYLTGKTETREDGRQHDTGWRQFWEALGLLENIGLVEFVAHLVTADSDEGSILHPYAVGNGEAQERAIAAAAHDAGMTMLAEHQAKWAEDNNVWLAPVLQHIADVAMVGILRTKYCARTSATAVWFDPAEWEQWASKYRTLQHQGEIKEKSRGYQ